MRLWSLHPCHLDASGLVALWREGLLAQAVLAGRTRGYRRHPQLIRFRNEAEPVALIGTYLWAVHAEAVRRGYRFDGARIESGAATIVVDVPRGQVDFEWRHLMAKLARRSPAWREWNETIERRLHPLFRLVDGGTAHWEAGESSTRNTATRQAGDGERHGLRQR